MLEADAHNKSQAALQSAKAKSRRKEVISVAIDTPLRERLDKWAKGTGVSRAAAISVAVSAMLGKVLP